MNGNGSRRIALLVEYQGTAYGGSQYQKNAPTVQGALERALGTLTGEPIRVAMAGRTDAGVHARGQVAAFPTESRRRIDVFVRGTNAHLPDDIAIHAAAVVPAEFDPRRHARRRWYRYTLDLRSERPALDREVVWRVGPSLDLVAMAAAARHLEGCHDFAAFTAPSEARRRRTERVVHGTALVQRARPPPSTLRRIMGTLVEVGRGKLSPEAFERLVREAAPGEASRTAPARGLCLIKVRYESGLFDDETDEDLQPFG